MGKSHRRSWEHLRYTTVLTGNGANRLGQAKDEISPERSSDFDEGARSAMTVTMYSTPWCGYCQRLKAQMGREGIAYTEVNIEQDSEAADFVMQVNGGNQTVPTLLYSDGTAATNPSLKDVKAKLEMLAAL